MCKTGTKVCSDKHVINRVMSKEESQVRISGGLIL